jgi:hypothetical protein
MVFAPKSAYRRSPNVFRTPVLLIIFNRTDTTQQVFDAIRQTQPRQLFVAADGPREDKYGEAEKCQRTREIVKQVDWDCEVRTLFQEKNLGCGPGPATAINWFFENVEEGIVLEDDCLPCPDFFVFCETLLDYYRDNEKIMHISGNNFQYGRKRGKGSYYFSTYTHNWGWATWRRAWKHYDFYCTSAEHRKHAWDEQWLRSVRRINGLAVLPNVNLISNIGFGPDATHTTEAASKFGDLPTERLSFPLVHPHKISRNRAADRYTLHNIFWDRTIEYKILSRIANLIPSRARTFVKSALHYISARKKAAHLRSIL